MYSDEFLNKFTADKSVIGMAVEVSPADGEPLRAHTGTGTVVIDGHVFYGVSSFGNVGSIPAVDDGNPASVQLELSGIPSELTSQCLNASLTQAPATIYALVFDESFSLDAYEIAMVGFVTDYKLVTGESSKIQLQVSDEFEKFSIPLNKFWTDQSHRSDHPASALCQYASQNAEREIQWGSKNDAPPMKSV